MPEPKKVEEEVNAKVDEVDDSLVESVQAKLDAINGVTDDTDITEDDDTDDQQTDDDKVDDDSTPGDQADDDTTEEDSTSDDDKDTDETGDTDDSKDEKDTKEVQLPDAYYRAAIHQGWEPDEVKEFFKANPEMALKTLEQIHKSTNKLTSEFARIGRIKPEDKTADSKTDDDESAIDIAALKEQYGDDSAVVKAFEVMQSKLDARPEQEVAQLNYDIPQNDPLRATVDKFFTDPTLKPYVDFYGEGKDTEKLTQEQHKHRFDMLTTAEDIIVGSQTHGRAITVEDAMEAAHLLVSEPVREKALRVELTAKVKKRAKSVTLKPTKSKAAKTKTDGKLTKGEMEAKVRAGLQHVFR